MRWRTFWRIHMPAQRRQEPGTDPEKFGEYKLRYGVIDKDPAWIVRTFRRRRRIAFALVGLGVAGWIIPGLFHYVSLALILVSLLPVAIAIHLYRCPQCGQQPLEQGGIWVQSLSQWGIDLNPRLCAMCGARLR